MRKILIVDDDADIIASLKEKIVGEMHDVECISESDFSLAPARLVAERPDAVVLDLLQNGTEGVPAGQESWRRMWAERFCPLVFYSAFEGDLIPGIPPSHPFIKRVNKGANTLGHVVQHLRGFIPVVEAITALHKELDLVVQKALRDTAAADGSQEMAEFVIHASKRRVAALMDEQALPDGRRLKSWEQYLVPAFGSSPMTGDILRRSGATWNDATKYRLVLSPSCDLVAGRHESTILVAKCEGPARMKGRLSLPTNANKALETVRRMLTQGHHNGFLPLPEFPGRIPHMVAYLKDLEVLSYEEVVGVEGATPTYERVASIDSPFREQVAWVFLSTVARPGMPERDMEEWARGIVEAT